MNRLIEKTVCWGLVTACRLATWPTSRSPSLVNATTEGVVRPPSALGITTGSPPSMTATTELVVPRSMPMIFEAMLGSLGLEEAETGIPARLTRSSYELRATVIPGFSAELAVHDIEHPRTWPGRRSVVPARPEGAPPWRGDQASKSAPP